jgi:hypothetical protein
MSPSPSKSRFAAEYQIVSPGCSTGSNSSPIGSNRTTNWDRSTIGTWVAPLRVRREGSRNGPRDWDDEAKVEHSDLSRYATATL